MASVENKQQLQALIAEVLEVDVAEVTDDAVFVDDLDADSLRVIEILSRMEKAFGVQIDQSKLAQMTSLAAVERILDDVLLEKI